jgi:hypothetical protein
MLWSRPISAKSQNSQESGVCLGYQPQSACCTRFCLRRGKLERPHLEPQPCPADAAVSFDWNFRSVTRGPPACSGYSLRFLYSADCPYRMRVRSAGSAADLRASGDLHDTGNFQTRVRGQWSGMKINGQPMPSCGGAVSSDRATKLGQAIASPRKPFKSFRASNHVSRQFTPPSSHVEAAPGVGGAAWLVDRATARDQGPGAEPFDLALKLIALA